MASDLHVLRQVSPDGRELWNWANGLSDAVARQSHIADLRSRLAKLGRCGDCDKWMKSSQCPAEVRGRNGRYSGPSMNAHPCAQYSEKTSSSDLRRQLQAELDALAKPAAGG